MALWVEALQWLMVFIMVFIIVLIAIYIAVRVGAVAWFRSRRESAHRMMRELKGDE